MQASFCLEASIGILIRAAWLPSQRGWFSSQSSWWRSWRCHILRYDSKVDVRDRSRCQCWKKNKKRKLARMVPAPPMRTPPPRGATIDMTFISRVQQHQPTPPTYPPRPGLERHFARATEERFELTKVIERYDPLWRFRHLSASLDALWRIDQSRSWSRRYSSWCTQESSSASPPALGGLLNGSEAAGALRLPGRHGRGSTSDRDRHVCQELYTAELGYQRERLDRVSERFVACVGNNVHSSLTGRMLWVQCWRLLASTTKTSLNRLAHDLLAAVLVNTTSS